MFRNVCRIYRLWIIASLLIFGAGRGLAQTTLSVVAGSAIAGGDGSLSISVTSTSGYAPAAVEWTLGYSAATLGSLKFQTGAAATAAGKSMDCRFTPGSARCLVWGMNDKTIANGVVARLSFAVSSRATSSSPIGLTGVVATAATGAPIKTSGIGVTLKITSQISGLACSPSPLIGAGTATCTVKLTEAASTSVLVTLGLGPNSAKVTIPSSVTIPAGATDATFALEAVALPSSETAVIEATIGGSSASFSLLLKP